MSRPSLALLLLSLWCGALSACAGRADYDDTGGGGGRDRGATWRDAGSSGGDGARDAADDATAGRDSSSGTPDGARADVRRGDGPCTPSCGQRRCGDNGCGGSCGSCAAWQACSSAGACECARPRPAGWPASVTPWAHNPMVVPTRATAVHGADNIYAPEIHRIGGGFVMWYGGQGSDGHDRIFVATSVDGTEWRKWPRDAAPAAALDRGGSNHVNDPTVVRVGNTWHMYYTDAPTGIDDEIWLARSATLTGFKKVRRVLDHGPAGSWESLKVGRPAVLYEGGVYKMWYDGQDGKSRHVGYATSTDGVTFTRFAGNPVLRNAGAIDVKKVGGVYVMLREAGDGTYWATSVDGAHCWTDRGKLFGNSGAAYDRHGQVTPFLQVEGGKLRAVWFGGASVSTWNKNRVAVAYPGGNPPTSGGGCSACTPWGLSCSAACQAVKAPPLGRCGAPGSTNSGACCACNASPCASCIVGAADCHAACVNAGTAGGTCAHPGSTDTSRCCACWR